MYKDLTITLKGIKVHKMIKKWFCSSIVTDTFVFLHLIMCFFQLDAELDILVQDVSINVDFRPLGKSVKRHASVPNQFVISSLGATFLKVCNTSYHANFKFFKQNYLK